MKHGNPGSRWTPLPGPNTVLRRQTKVVISEKCPKMMGARNVDLGEIVDGRAWRVLVPLSAALDDVVQFHSRFS